MIIHHKYIKYSQHFGNLYNVTGHIELHSNDLDTTKVVYLGVKITCNDLNIDTKVELTSTKDKCG